MTKLIKKSVSIILTLLLLLSMVSAMPLFVRAATFGDFEYTINGTNATITKYNGEDSVVEIPSMIEDYTVAAIGYEAFDYCTSITSVTLPDTVTSIEESAFKYCYNITSLTIPDSVETIGDYAFCYCSSITNLTIGEGVSSIGNYTFANCYQLTDVSIPDSVESIGDYAFYFCTILENVTLGSSVVTIGDGGFQYCYKLKSLTVPESVESIGNEVFRYCNELSKVTFQNSETVIGSNAFYACNPILIGNTPSTAKTYALSNNLVFIDTNNASAIESTDFSLVSQEDGLRIKGYNGTKTDIIIPQTIHGLPVVSIGSYAFSYSDITSITIPDSVTKLEDSAFYYCSSLENVTLSSNISEIEDYTFYGCSELKGVTIPDSVTSIGYDAFYDCNNLKDIVIGSGLKTIPSGVFSGLYNLENLTLSEGIENIDNYAFYGCTGINELIIPDSVKQIGDFAFYNCSGFSELTIPVKVESIGYNAFYGCSNLSKVSFLSARTEIGYDAFGGCAERLTFYAIDPSEAKAYAEASNGQIAYEELVIGSGFKFSIDENYSAIITLYKGIDSIVEIPTEIGGCTVVGIADGAFYGCTDLRSVIIPRTVTTIGSTAFEGCSNLTIFGYDDSMAETYARANGIPFTLMVKTNTGNNYTYTPFTNIQTKDSEDTSFELDQSIFRNIELLGVQKKADSNTNDMRFVAVVNEGIIRDANEGGDISDYGFVIAKTDYKSTVQAKEKYITKASLDAPATVKRSCMYTENSFSGKYGRKSTETKYKYLTLAIENVPNEQGFVVRFYIKTKSGKVYYASYKNDYTGCVTSYSMISSIDEGENAVRYPEDWESLTDFEEG